MEASFTNVMKENEDLQGGEHMLSPEIVSKLDDEELHINRLPDSIFLHIFSYLPFSSVGSVAQVSHRWRLVSKDDLLWKSIFLQHYRLPMNTSMAPRAKSWRYEFKRLYYHTPCILSEERKEHRDEVLHVSVSHDGTMFATCSKDGFFKVWKSTHPSRLLFERYMMSLFSWKYTQFSQFNETDTCLLVSGVYFGSESTAGEIAVFDLEGDYRMQCRVNNKPYDVFGAWYDNDHLLSGTLYWRENFRSVSAVWLSKASQEVESEMESVSMVLYRFDNVNSSSISLLHVAEVETNQQNEEVEEASAIPTSKNTNAKKEKRPTHGITRLPGRTCPNNAVPSEMSKLLRKNIAEDEFDISDEDESQDDTELSDEDEDGMNEEYNRRKKHQIVNNLDNEFRKCSRSFYNSDRNALYRCDMADVGEQSTPGESSPIIPLESLSPQMEDELSTGGGGLEGTCRFLEEEHQQSSNVQITVNNASAFLSSANQMDATLRLTTDDDDFASAKTVSLDCSDTNPQYPVGDFEENAETDSSNNCEAILSNEHILRWIQEDDDLLVADCLMDYAAQTEAIPSRASSLQSLSHASQASSLSKELCENHREKLLIYTWGSETYIPHKVGIKRMKSSDFCKGARPASILLPDVMENLHNMDNDRRNVPDTSIDMHGHIVGLCLSPDQRYLYVNCRPWPPNCIITDAHECPPLAQEVEIVSIDLTTFKFTGPVLRSHKAYAASDKGFFLNLSVSDDYVVSGAEDRKGYIWDRHYGIPLYRFDHEDVVNSVALNPRNPEVAVSVSDDRTFKVWKSRSQMNKHKQKGMDMGHNPRLGLVS